MSPLDLDPYGGTDPLGMLNLFLKRTADVLAPRLSGAIISSALWVLEVLSYLY